MQKNYQEITDNFRDEKFVISFFNKNKEKLGIEEEVKNLEIKIHNLSFRGRNIRFIATYSFSDRGEEKKLTVKLRIFRDKNFARKAWTMSSLMWRELSGEDKFIAKPLAWFEDLDVFVYETAPGKSLSSILKTRTMNRENLEKKIKIVAMYLAELHKMEVENFSKVPFYDDFNALSIIDHFAEDLVGSEFFASKQLIDFTEEMKTGLKKYAKPYNLVHGDFQVENFIFDGDFFKLIDFDNMEINDPMLDVGNFLVQIFYGGIIGEGVEYLRQTFLEEYLECNEKLDMEYLNQRINLFVVLAKIRNIHNIFSRPGPTSEENKKIVKKDLKRIEARLANPEKDPLEFFFSALK